MTEHNRRFIMDEILSTNLYEEHELKVMTDIQLLEAWNFYNYARTKKEDKVTLWSMYQEMLQRFTDNKN